MTWRHAIIFDGPNSLAHAAVARELLEEWGKARGLSQMNYVTQQLDYRIGHGMEFDGEMDTTNAGTSRLQGAGSKWPEYLSGMEEHVPWPLPEGWRAEAPPA